MTTEKKQEYLDQYTAVELLNDAKLISEDEYRKIEYKLLRTIMGYFAVECNKTKETEHSETDEGKNYIKL